MTAMLNRLNVPNLAQRAVSVFERFVNLEASGGILLMASALAALVWANSPFADTYFQLWATRLYIGVADVTLNKPLLLWINDGLMAVFFLVVGLEIKREFLMGELASPRLAALPVAAALGGMFLPAGLYALINAGSPTNIGWGIPMATDIAFAVGVLALLGSRAPLSLKVFVTAVAIVDDLGSVLVIALFYTESISWVYLGAALIALLALIGLSRLKVNHSLPYLLVGLVLWVAMLKSGVHATIAGVLLAMTIPAGSRVSSQAYQSAMTSALAAIQSGDPATNDNLQAAALTVEDVTEDFESPLHDLEHRLHPWVSYGILPLFALANAGVSLGAGDLAQDMRSPVIWGVVAGLALGKPVGIVLASWLAVKLKLATLLPELEWKSIIGAGMLAGIGFTMAVFVATLAFGEGETLHSAKIGIIIASLLAGAAGWTYLRFGVGR